MEAGLELIMVGRIKKSWRLFESSDPGTRFRDRYRRRQHVKRSRFDLTKIIYIVGGIALIIVSVFIGWLPIFGWGTIFLGLGMVAGEFKPAARLMDWLEVRARRLFRPVARLFVRLPYWAKLCVSLAIAIATFGLVYGVYRLTFGG